MFTDIMVDLETTGTDPAHSNILQLAAVKFNLKTREVCPVSFDMCLSPAPNRFWDESTREFWHKMPKIYSSFVERMKPPAQVLEAFYRWVLADQPDQEGGYRFWAKPVTFDWTFLASYCKQYDIPMPFHYRYARDVNTYIAGLRGTPEHHDYGHMVEFVGDEHNALWDDFHQIEVLFKAQDEYEANR